MPIDTATITGSFSFPDDNFTPYAKAVFELSGFDTDGAVIVPRQVTTNLGENGELNVELWPNQDGLRGTFYWVAVDIYRDPQFKRFLRRFDFGKIQVIGNADITSLLDTPVDVPGVWYRAITQAQYDDVIEAADNAADSATAAAGSATAAAASATAAATSAATIDSRWFVPFDDRAAFLAATIPAGVERVSFFDAAGETYSVVREAGGPIVQANGQRWAPDGEALSPHYGVVPGTLDNQVPALAAAMAAHTTVTIPSGAARLTSRLDIPAGRRLVGRELDAGFQRDFPTPGPGRNGVLQMASGADVLGLTVSMALALDTSPPLAVAPYSVMFQTPVGTTTDIRLSNVTVDGSITINPETGIRSANGGIWWPGTGENIDGLTIENSSFRRFFWGLLQPNTVVATIRNVNLVGNTFDEMGSTYALFNAPHSSALNENILVAFNYLGSNLSTRHLLDPPPVGFAHRGSFAGQIRYSRLIGNHAGGRGSEMFRAEEQAVGSVWIGNTAKLQGRRGIDIIPNNADPTTGSGELTGPCSTPTEFTIGNNVLRRVLDDGTQDYTASTTSENLTVYPDPSKRFRAGLSLAVNEFQTDKADAETLSESTVHDNISSGWGQGLLAGQGFHRSMAHHNVLVRNGVGMTLQGPTLGVHDNLLTDNDVAIRFMRGGLAGRVHIRSTGHTPAPQEIEVVGGAGGITGWTFETGRREWVNGLTVIPLIRIGSRIDADVIIAVSRDTITSEGFEAGRLIWDGTTLTYHSRTRLANGTLIPSLASPWGIKDGYLACGVFNSSGSTTPTNDRGRLQVQLTGLHIWE